MSSSHMKLSTILPFHIYAETFSKLLQVAKRRAEIKGVVVARHAPRILHLCFVDDSLILCKATLGAVQSIREILRIYERASGEVINLQKSEVIFSSNTPEELRPQLTRIMNVRVVEKFDNYFGLLSIVGRSKLEIFNSLCDCIWKRVLGWKEKLLSQAGKESTRQDQSIFVASMQLAIPTISNLPRRKINISSNCSLCGLDGEDENHALLDCAFARQPIWGIGLLKANFDRAIFSNTGDAGLGVIIRNERSKCVAWRSIRIPHIHQAKLAKALATRAAMQACIHFGFSRIILEGDCHNIISSLSSNNIDYSPLGHILLDKNLSLPM
ncbi:hypothetical protein Sango_2434800 [Sesamum angolense]|uniref:Reverse transcriptase n=1 Tax=Sesamum angolense TaxID=2727404 RepID=A0AAE1W7Q0_9LAMI|nr:hypothetical protein Sango_2434800 [Sesamum angolense]